MKLSIIAGVSALLIAFFSGGAAHGQSGNWTLVGWNNLGMHCMDADYSVFSLLPPYNTFHAQLIDPNGRLVRDPSGLHVTYQAVADPDGSINSTAVGKTNFWSFVESLFGVELAPDLGLAGYALPGPANQPQPMVFDPVAGWFVADGVPITPYDDQGRKNPYPLLRLVARDARGAILATTDIVVPVSDEMSCRTCHASGSSPAAEPPSGWVNDPEPERDMRLNILRLHDDREMSNPVFVAALGTAGYSPAGLFAHVMEGRGSILCARCHLSEALPGSGVAGVSPLTQAIHRRMAFVLDPITDLPLDDVANRSACYRCHPGAVTRCLRGVMGASVSADGAQAIQCQSCHGRMIEVAAEDRTGWLDEPNCQSCHTGTAMRNNGQIRYVNVFEPNGERRIAVDATFATTPDTPAPGLSLYRFSLGHGGLACEACHGSTHAELPSSHRNDNLQSLQLQGHVGVLADCAACHGNFPETIAGGPHGLHPLGDQWVDQHGDAVEQQGAEVCRSCHGADHRGTVLSRSLGDRALNTRYGTKVFWRGFQVGCYACHRGPTDDDPNPNHAAVVQDASVSTRFGESAALSLSASDADGDPLALRIVTQPANGTVSLNARMAEYFPAAGYSGTDHFTFAAWDGSADSNLGTVTVSVVASCVGDCNSDGVVTVDELVTAVRIALGESPVTLCGPCDSDSNQVITINEIIAAVNHALSGCEESRPAD